jgi:urease beta subunit
MTPDDNAATKITLHAGTAMTREKGKTRKRREVHAGGKHMLEGKEGKWTAEINALSKRDMVRKAS